MTPKFQINCPFQKGSKLQKIAATLKTPLALLQFLTTKHVKEFCYILLPFYITGNTNANQNS